LLESAVVRVRDSGIGIAPELLPHVFETFTQADRSMERSRGGLGLGLALVKGLVALHGGEVRAHSEGTGRGAEFVVLLPLAEADPRASGSQESPCGSSGGVEDGPKDLHSARILIIEDNPDAAETLRDLLKLSGYEVAVALSGPAGIETARQFRPTVVLCDLGLPEMDGYAVATALRRDPVTASARLIALSGYAQEEDRRRAMAAGFDAHLGKPLDPAELQRWLACVPTER
jgi:CheY-like chemotaxis protein